MHTEKGSRQKVIAIALVAAVLIAVGGVFLLFYSQQPRGLMGQIPVTASTTMSVSTAAATSTIPAPLSRSTPVTQEVAQGMRLYTNASFNFSLSYPDDLRATEYREAGNALTASFQDPSTGEGFEVYVTPYSDTQVTEARFKLDEPSGTFQEPTGIIVGGVQAVMFYGYNPIMGDTREVWFIRNGFLYEVTTYKQLDSWLAGIMQTWRFVQ
jgi:hypothetical protein